LASSCLKIFALATKMFAKCVISVKNEGEHQISTQNQDPLDHARGIKGSN